MWYWLLEKVVNLSYRLGINSKQLRARLKLYGIFGSVNTLAEAQEIDHLFAKDSGFRAKVIKKRIELAQQNIVSDDTEEHQHLTYEDIERFYFFVDADELSNNDVDFVQEAGYSIDSCEVCMRKYRFFLDSEKISLGEAIQHLSEMPSRSGRNSLGADVQHSHISIEEMELLVDLNSANFNSDEFSFAWYMNDKIDSCTECLRRYRAFIGLRSSFGSFRHRNIHEFHDEMMSQED